MLMEYTDGYQAHMMGTGSIYLPDPYLAQMEEDYRQRVLAYEREMARFAALSPREQHFENLMRARYGS